MSDTLKTLRALERDTFDQIALRVYGYTSGVTEQIVALNPQIACILKIQNVIMAHSDASETTLSSVLFPRFDETCPDTALEITVQHHPQ